MGEYHRLRFEMKDSMAVYSGERLRVALVVGNLGVGGAEKQAVYVASSLRAIDADVLVFYMRRGEYYESALNAAGIRSMCLGDISSNPCIRLITLIRQLRAYQPHIVQSCHFWTNIYAGIGGRACHAISLGALRNSLSYDRQTFHSTAALQLRLPSVLVANSYAAKQEAEALGIPSTRAYVLQNAIDLPRFDHQLRASHSDASKTKRILVIGVGRLVAAKRFDRFLRALADARARNVQIHGLLVGDGPERQRLETLAYSLGLQPQGITFLGERHDVPTLLTGADLLVLTSDNEGFPNVILEAMAAALPIVTTPAGDAGTIVTDSSAGYVVPFSDSIALSQRIITLADHSELRSTMGQAGRARVERDFALTGMASRLLALYEAIAHQHKRTSLLHCVENLRGIAANVSTNRKN